MTDDVRHLKPEHKDLHCSKETAVCFPTRIQALKQATNFLPQTYLLNISVSLHSKIHNGQRGLRKARLFLRTGKDS